MASASLGLESRSSQCDALLEQACLALELTNTQYFLARDRYQAVGKWLSAEESPLAPFHPEIYPQGSMRIGTTNRPWRHVEFDLDLVCELQLLGEVWPRALYDAVYSRMASNGIYQPMLEKRARCIRINYTGDFHLDIVPARPDPMRRDGGILIPDSELASWKTSNPKRFAEMFFEQCKLTIDILAKRVQPLPSPVPSEAKFTLQRAVQLLKRSRDVYFDGDDSVARSVLLTALAGSFYRGEQSLSQALIRMLDGIIAAIRECHGILAVPNPSNPDENFSASWTAETYSQFVEFVGSVRFKLNSLLGSHGLEATSGALSSLYGPNISQKAFNAYGKEIEKSRNANALRVTSKTATLTTSAIGLAIPKNNFYGR